MQHLSLTEYSTTLGVELSATQVDALRQALPDLRMFPSAGAAGSYDLTPASTVGTVVLEGLRVDIAPKIRPRSLLYMMSTPVDPRVWGQDVAGMDTASHLVEAIVPTFLHHAEVALSRGPLHRYAVRDDRLPTIRGRILFERQIRTSPGIPLPAHVQFDEHTPDIEENRVLRAAIRRLRYLATHPAYRHRLSRLEAALAEVTSVSYAPSTIPVFDFDRLNEHYRDALTLATLVLRNTGLEHRLGHLPAVTFLADMNKVFENFVVASLRAHLRLTPQQLDQGCAHHRVYLDALPPAAGKVRLRPDISWWHGKDCVFVGDVKYKRLDPKGYEHGDLYQLLAYLTALGLPEGLLVYPTSEADAESFEVPMSGKRLRIHVLPVDSEPADIDGAVRALVTAIRTIAARVRYPTLLPGVPSLIG